MQFERIKFSEAPWEQLEQLPDRTVYQTREWMDFVAETQQAEPVLARIRHQETIIGYFSALIIRRFGMRILGSPFPGWSTSYMGFNLLSPLSRQLLLRALAAFAFDDLQCLHVEFCDRNFRFEDAAGTGFLCGKNFTYETDLTPCEDDILARMDSDRRRRIRVAEKSGIRVEEAHDAAFGAEFHEQLAEMFTQRGLASPFERSRIEKLIQHLLPTGHLLALRAREPSGKCIASAIYAGMNRRAELLGIAAQKAFVNRGPHETLHWYAMRYWKKQGAKVLDWGGGGTYKEQYGVACVFVPRFGRSRLPFMAALRNGAQRALEWKQQRFERMAAKREASKAR